VSQSAGLTTIPTPRWCGATIGCRLLVGGDMHLTAQPDGGCVTDINLLALIRLNLGHRHVAWYKT
jgi:hypothetical protein